MGPQTVILPMGPVLGKISLVYQDLIQSDFSKYVDVVKQKLQLHLLRQSWNDETFLLFVCVSVCVHARARV